MSLSSVKSETALRSRLFSSSRSFRRASPARSSAPRTPGATDTSLTRSGGLRPPCSGPARPEHRPTAASRRSLQACIASLPLQSSWISKTYLKSDHFNGGGSSARNKTFARFSEARRGLVPATGPTYATRPAMPCCLPADDRDSTRRLPPQLDRGTRSSRR